MTVAYVANVGFVLNLLIHPHIYIFILQVCQLLAFAVLRLFHYLLQNHKFNLFIIYISIDLFFCISSLPVGRLRIAENELSVQWYL